MNKPKFTFISAALAFTSLLGLVGCTSGGGGGGAVNQTLRGPSRSSSIVLTSDDRRVIAVNRETNTVSVLEVRDAAGTDVARKVAEVPVGLEPCAVALSPDDQRAYITNTVSGTVSVLHVGPLSPVSLITEIPVGTEPRGIALTPNGSRAYVANHTDGTVSVIDTTSDSVVQTIQTGGNPTAIAISNDGDLSDTDEQVYVTEFFAEVVPGGPGPGFDTGSQGVVHVFDVAGLTAPTKITLSPLSNAGFTADRAPFCSQFNPTAHSDIFCPDQAATDPASDVIARSPQGAYPNQLQSILLRNNLVYLPNIGAAPEPPVRFNVNVQALVHVLDTATLSERTELHVNLNDQIKTETQPADPTSSLDRLFGNDFVAIDATDDGTEFLIVSRGGNYVLRATADGDGRLNIGAPTGVIRLQTGNIPTGVVVSRDGQRAYTVNEVNVSITALDLETNTVLDLDIPSGAPPLPGTFEHGVLLGKLVFHTALGTPDNELFGSPIRNIVPLASRGKASDNGWSSCASCHPDGLADGVTWFFPTGPRQTIPLDGFFAKDNPADQRISNWSAVRGSITDFNNNARNIQGGIGFAGDPPDGGIFNHGITQGASDALDAMTLWTQTVRPRLMPPPSDTLAAENGRLLFQDNCASCHGGAKWTKSQVVYLDNPAFDGNPLAGGSPLDPGINNAGPQIVSYTLLGRTIPFLENINTFDVSNPQEIRGAGATGNTAVGGLGFNVPSLLGTGYNRPFFHDGSAATLSDVFKKHALTGGVIEDHFSGTELDELRIFLNSIDGRTEPLQSATDQFLDLVGN